MRLDLQGREVVLPFAVTLCALVAVPLVFRGHEVLEDSAE